MRFLTLLITGALSVLPLAYATAQTTTTTTTTVTTTPPPEAGSFDKLSPGGQKIASAIFKAEVQPTTTTSGGTATGTGTSTGTGTGTTSTSPKPLTLDQIAKLKLDGQGWGVIFKNLKAQNLVTTKNLGQAVSAYNHSQNLHSGTGVTTTASGRVMRDGQGGGLDAIERRGGDDDKSGNGWKSGSDSSSTRGAGSSSAGNSGGGSNSGRGDGVAYGHSK